MNENNVNVVELTEVNGLEEEVGQLLLKDSSLNLISDMQVQLRVDIGELSLTVNELYGLKKGEVLKLDCEVNSPLRLCFGENTVAEGILVAADNHYAIEITAVTEFS